MYVHWMIWILMLSPVLLNAQHVVMGNVTDENGEPLPGANIWLSETQQGTMSDADGFYLIKLVASGTKKLKVSYIGYEEQEITVVVKGATYQDFQLTAQAYEMPGVEILGSWANDATPVTYTNLSKELLEKDNLAQDVPYLLQWTPSAVVTSDAGTGIGYTGIRIRGTDPTRINVTINGVPLNDAESQGVFWVDLPDFISSTENVQIQRGVGTSTNGAGAFGATIRLNTAKVHEKAYAQLDNSFGSFNSWKHSVQVGTGLLGNHFTLDGRLSRITSDGYIDRATSRLHSFFLSGAYMGKKNSLRANVFSGHEVTYQAWNGVPAQYINNEELRTFNTAGTERAGTPYEDEVDDYTQTHFQLLYKQQLSEVWHLDVTGHYTVGKGFFEQYKADQALATYALASTDTMDLVRRRWLDNDFYGVSALLGFDASDGKTSTTLGVAAYNYLGRHFGEVIWTAQAGNFEIPPLYYDNDAEKLDANVFGKIQYYFLSTLTGFIDVQYRMVNYQFEGLDNTGQRLSQEVDHHFFNPKAGLTYQFKDEVQLYTSFAVANREPNRDDYVDSAPHNRPNSERLYNTELGLRTGTAKSFANINFYHMYYKDQLALTGQINDVGEATRVNIQKSYRLGIELEGRNSLGPRFQSAASLTWSRNKAKAFTEFIDNWDTNTQERVEHTNTNLAFSPSWVGGYELTWLPLTTSLLADKHSLELSYLLKTVSKQNIDNTGNENTELPSYSFTNLRLRYQLKAKPFETLTLTFLIQNIWDNQYSTNAWTYRYRSAGYDARMDDPYARLEEGATYNLTGFYPQAGRSYLLGLSVAF